LAGDCPHLIILQSQEVYTTQKEAS